MTGDPAAFRPLEGHPPVPILDAVRGQCRWPVDPDAADPVLAPTRFFCGVPVPEGASRCWCERHQALGSGAGTTSEKRAVDHAKAIARRAANEAA